MMTVLPPPDWPTTIVVWRVIMTSYSCTTLSTCAPAAAAAALGSAEGVTQGSAVAAAAAALSLAESVAQG